VFQDLKDQPADKILALIAAFRDDLRTDKIDLGVGVYKDATGLTPVMRAVKAAEKRIYETQTTKTYTTLAGDPAYADAMIGLVLGNTFPRDRIAAVATPGGTGAIRQGLEMIRYATPDTTVWLSNPTWPNHPSIIRYLGMRLAEYRYFDATTRGVDFSGMLADLGGVKPGDVVLLHGCCHNPTGANPTAEQWAEITTLLKAKGAIPFIDLAYQGFGDGLEADAAATRMIAGAVDECLIAVSCSKNFGIYRERTGLIMAITAEPGQHKNAQGTLAFLNRQNYSFPPDHGARVVTTILNDPALRADWMDELEQVRQTMLTLRQSLAAELQRLTNSDRFGFIASHRGMFSQIGATPEQVEQMRAGNGIYMVSDSRMNIAGLNAATVPILAGAILAVGV
jgi:aspartate aminotransferase